jgi:predicted transcriptional regulator of viral defense system
MKLDLLLSPELVVFTTRDYARAAGVSVAAASRQLTRLRLANRSLLRLTRGAWASTAHPHFSALACVPVLLGGEQGYVSFLTALHLHGALSQIPAAIQVATTGHARRLRTPVGLFEFIQLKPELFAAGVEWSDTLRPYRIATVEKALFDTLYLSTRKNRRFARLAELELADAGFHETRYLALVKQHQVPPQVAKAMRGRFEQLRRSSLAA